MRCVALISGITFLASWGAARLFLGPRDPRD